MPEGYSDGTFPITFPIWWQPERTTPPVRVLDAVRNLPVIEGRDIPIT